MDHHYCAAEESMQNANDSTSFFKINSSKSKAKMGFKFT